MFQTFSDSIFSIIGNNAQNRAKREAKLLEERKEAGVITEEQYEAQLEQVQQAVNQMQQNQQALANHLGAGSQMASNHNQRLLDLNQRQIGLAGLLQPQRPMTQGPESMMLRQIGGRPQ